MSTIDRLLEIMEKLRDPRDGCPWDLQQSFATIVPYTIEEAYEVAEAATREDAVDLADELGDLLFQVVFHAQMAKEKGWFEFEAVVGAITDKMVRRHPHVFGDEAIADARSQSLRWEEHKAAERSQRGQDTPVSRLDGVADGLPALRRAWKLQRRAARAGFDWPDTHGVVARIREETAELEAEIRTGEEEAQRHELGDLLFSCVNLARHMDMDPDQALREANLRFQRRFRQMEIRADAAGECLEDADTDTLETWWEDAKRAQALQGEP